LNGSASSSLLLSSLELSDTQVYEPKYEPATEPLQFFVNYSLFDRQKPPMSPQESAAAGAGAGREGVAAWLMTAGDLLLLYYSRA